MKSLKLRLFCYYAQILICIYIHVHITGLKAPSSHVRLEKTKTWPVGALKLDDICEGGPDPMSTLAIGSNRPSKSECSDTGSAARG